MLYFKCQQFSANYKLKAGVNHLDKKRKLKTQDPVVNSKHCRVH